MDHLIAPSSHPPRRVHATDPDELLRVWHEDLTDTEREIALETARGTPLKAMGRALGSTAGAGRYARARNDIAEKVRARCPDLQGPPAVRITTLVHAVYPHSTAAEAREPQG